MCGNLSHPLELDVGSQSHHSHHPVIIHQLFYEILILPSQGSSYKPKLLKT